MIIHVFECGCGFKSDTVPAGYKVWQPGDFTDGIYWDCPNCRSTHVAPLESISPSSSDSTQTR